MSRLSTITGLFAWVFILLAVAVFDASVVAGIVFAIIGSILTMPAIIEGNCIADNQYEEKIRNDFKN